MNPAESDDRFHESLPAHLAIIHRRFLRMILDGSKTAEARLGKTRRLPYKGLDAGHAVYLKPPGGDLVARATAARVHRFELEGPADVRRIRAEFGPMLGDGAGPDNGPDNGPDTVTDTEAAADAYWASKADARYATIIELSAVTRIERAPAWYRPASNRSAWRLLGAG